MKGSVSVSVVERVPSYDQYDYYHTTVHIAAIAAVMSLRESLVAQASGHRIYARLILNDGTRLDVQETAETVQARMAVADREYHPELYDDTYLGGV